MKTIVKTIFGSTLFGTNTPESDMDYKAVVIPDPKELLLGRHKDIINTSTGQKNKKNTKDDTDLEIFSLKSFLYQAMEGQTYALDMLFTPDNMIVEKTPQWDFIIQNREKLLHSNISSFVSFAINQANKYKDKGNRLKKLKELNSFLQGLNPNHRLEKYKDELSAFEFVNIEEIQANKHTDKMISCISVFGKMALLNSSVKVALSAYLPMEKEYGKRAQAAEKFGVDFKSKYHALRVANEAIELLTTKSITFPRPEASLLLDIRAGKLGEDEVDDLIMKKLDEVSSAENSSSLPKEANKEFWDKFIIKCYKEEVNKI